MGDAILESSNSASLVTRHCCQTRSTAVCQFAQHYPVAEIIPTAAAWTDTAMVSNKVTNKGHEKQYPGEVVVLMSALQLPISWISLVERQKSF